MNINTIQTVANTINNNKKLKTSNKYLEFKGKIITKRTKLDNNVFKQISDLSNTYDKIQKIFANREGNLSTQLKDLFPNLIAGQKLKGFVFDSFGKNQNKRLQIAKLSTTGNNNELLTFGILNKNNKNIFKYRTSKDGYVDFIYDEDNIDYLPKEPFCTSADSTNYMSKIIDIFDDLKLYAENYLTIKKALYFPKQGLNKGNIFAEIFPRIKSLSQSNGIKNSINTTNDKYKDVSDLLKTKNSKESYILKENYFGNNYNLKTKGLDFSSVNPIYNHLSICPLKSKDDNRIYKIIFQDKSKYAPEAYILYDDGKISKQKNLDLSTNGFRPNNLEYITDEEIENLRIKNVLEDINKELDKFKNYIVNFRNIKENTKQEKKAKRLLEIETEKFNKLKAKEEKKIKKATLLKEMEEAKKIEKEKQAQIKKQEKLEKEKELAQLKETKRIEKEKLAQLKEQKRIEKEKQAQLKHQKKLEKQKQIELNKEEKNQNITSTQSKKINSIYNLNITNLVNKLNLLFSTPVENRSKHLIHKKLNNGKYFNGQFSLKAKNGANITVSRVKSPKYVEFTYYSINIDKDKKRTTINIDPSKNRIINSIDGKPIITDGIWIKYITLKEMINNYPEAENLPEYLTEIFSNK